MRTGLKKYFAVQAKDLLDKGVRIEQVNGIKTLFSVSPADGSYKVNFGEEEFMNYFKEFLASAISGDAVLIPLRIMSKYYYLVAGLPELTLEDSKLSYTVADFKSELYSALSEEDRMLIDLFYLQFDNANVLKLLKDKDAAIDPRGNYLSGRTGRVHFIAERRLVKCLSVCFRLICLLLFPSISISLLKMTSYMKIVWQHFIMPMP